jgi:hypothetical protein
MLRLGGGISWVDGVRLPHWHFCLAREVAPPGASGRVTDELEGEEDDSQIDAWGRSRSGMAGYLHPAWTQRVKRGRFAVVSTAPDGWDISKQGRTSCCKLPRGQTVG